MKCFMFEQLKLYVDDELSPSESKRLELHVENCLQCQNQLQECANNMLTDESSTYPEVSLPNSFTDEIMNKLSDAASAHSIRKHSSRTKRQRGWNIVKKAGLVVAGLTALVVTGTFVSPTFASYVQSLFQMEKQADNGMKNAVDKGFVKKLEQKATDQGITVEAKEILADSMRIAVIYDVYDQEGKQIDKSEHMLRPELIVPTGVDLLEEIRGDKQRRHGQYFIMTRDLNDLFMTVEEIPDQLTLRLVETTIAGKEGNWKLEIPIDMKKAKEATKTVSLDNEYKSPQGFNLRLKRVEFAPSATRVMLETELAKKAQDSFAQAKDIYEKGESQSKGLGLKTEFLHPPFSGDEIAYEIVNEQGEVLAAWDKRLLYKGIGKDKNVITMEGRGNEGGTMTWWHTFTPLQSEQKLTLRLKTIYETKQAYAKADIVPDDFDKQPGTLKDDLGNTFAFSSFVFEPGTDMNKEGKAIMTVEGTLGEGVVDTSSWTVKDENGKIYPVYMRPQGIRDKDGRVNIKGKMEISGMEQQPKKLTISFGEYTVEHHDVHWEVPIVTK